LSTTGGVAQELLRGDVSNIPRHLAVAVPGGLGLSRVYRTLNPKYADYDQYRTTGVVPIYDKENKLIGRYTPTQLMARAMGVRTINTAQEQEMAHYLLKQRDNLRQYRMDYLEALSQNNLEKAADIQTDFRKAYPDFGPLRVKKSDIRTIRRRREMSRLERIVQGLPSEYRPLYEQMVNMGISNQVGRMAPQGPEALSLLEF